MATWPHGRVGTGPCAYERRSGDGRTRGAQPRRDGRAGSVPLPHGTFSTLSAEAEYELRHPDYVMEMPQSGESIRGRENMREFQEAYPTPPSIQLRRVLVREGLWIVEGVNDYGGGQVFDVVLLIELKTGRCGGTDATTPSRSRHRSGERSG